MPTIIHESFTRRVDAAIQAQLDQFADGDSPTAEFARSIIPTGSLRMRFQEEDKEEGEGEGEGEEGEGEDGEGGEGEGGEGEGEEESTDLKFRRPLSQHEPDISFKHKDAKWPGVLIEISYSQKRKDLSRLADNYIIGSDGNIKVVVGLDIEYRGTQTASLSIWRPQVKVSDEDGQKELIATQTEVDKVSQMDRAI
jgi:hypothetical protein